MSEYKYACPVCGQHMMCDSSQAGTVMECPTCFQKITAPQAPAAGADQKFVLTGTKVGDRPVAKIPAAGPTVIMGGKNSLVGMAVAALVLIGLIGAGAAVFVFRGEIFHRRPATNAGGHADEASAKPVPINLPPASDTNWMLSLDAAVTPEAPAVGRVHGQSSTLDRAIFQAGMLTLRPSVKGSPEVSIAISFGGAAPEALAGQTINVTTNADKAARVTLRWKDGGENGKENFDNGYAMRLELGALANNHIPGRIYFCAPDDPKSYIMGTFNLEVRKPKPKAPAKPN